MELRLLRYFVTVAEERHVGRASVRLHMTQPPLSRAIKQLETELGTVLLERSAAGVSLTPAGSVLYDRARTLLEQADRLPDLVAAAGRPTTLTVGVLADSAEQAGSGVAAAFRQRHPHVEVRVREADFTDPTAGLRRGLVDVALTRGPFRHDGIRFRALRSDPVGVVLRLDDPLAHRDGLHLADLEDRRWFQLPEGADPVWRAYWTGRGPGGEARDGPVVRTVQECFQAVLWTGSIGLVPLPDVLPEGLTSVRLLGWPDSQLVVAWSSPDPVVRSFAQVAAAHVGTR